MLTQWSAPWPKRQGSPKNVFCRFEGWIIKNPDDSCECRGYKSGVDLLSHPQKGSTISASRLNFSVRNGKRWTMLL